MRLKGISVVWAAVIGAASYSSNAYSDESIQTLLQECNNQDDVSDQLHCVGYVGGVSDMINVNGLLITQYHEESANFVTFAICPGKPTPTYGVKFQVFKNWGKGTRRDGAEQDFRWSDSGLAGSVAMPIA